MVWHVLKLPASAWGFQPHCPSLPAWSHSPSLQRQIWAVWLRNDVWTFLQTLQFWHSRDKVFLSLTESTATAGYWQRLVGPLTSVTTPGRPQGFERATQCLRPQGWGEGSVQGVATILSAQKGLGGVPPCLPSRLTMAHQQAHGATALCSNEPPGR